MSTDQQPVVPTTCGHTSWTLFRKRGVNEERTVHSIRLILGVHWDREDGEFQPDGVGKNPKVKSNYLRYCTSLILTFLLLKDENMCDTFVVGLVL